MIELLIDKRPHDLGGGFAVGRVLPYVHRRMVGPFVFFDHMGPVDLAPGIPRSLDVRPHPHIGLATVTYLYDGALTHRDSVGAHREILPGEVNWMVAGSGITHSERFEKARAEGARMHGIQAWVALPDHLEECAPGFDSYAGPAELPEWREDGVTGRVIAGAFHGLSAATRVQSPLFYAHADLAPGARLAVPASLGERALYVANGAVRLGGTEVGEGRMAVLSGGVDALVTSEAGARIMLCGGEPVGERHLFWNFVSSSRERIEQAKADWRAGRMKLPDLDDEEFTPLPEERPSAPEPQAMS